MGSGGGGGGLGITPTPGFAAAVDKMFVAGQAGKGRDVEAERRGNVRRVLGVLGVSRGRVGEEGIARVARRVGFENDVDAETLTVEQRERRVGNRAVSIAGNTVVVDVTLREQVPRKVEVIHIGETAALQEHAKVAGACLLGDLVREGKGGRLGRFAESLEGLAVVDRLSSEKCNCFEGITGVYASLCRLYEAERKAMLHETRGEEGERKADAVVLSKKSGRPTLRARGRLGVGIEYWRNSVLDTSEATTAGQSGNNVVMKEADDRQEEASSAEWENTYCLRIEAERLHGELFPPIRISSNWLPEAFELPNPSSTEGLPWQDPPQTVLNADKQSADAMNMDPSNQKFPNVRFVVKIEPAITLPLSTAMNVLQAVGTTVPNFTAAQPAYHSLILPSSASTVTSGTSVLTVQRTTFSFANSQEQAVKHAYSLFVPEATALPYYGYRLEGLPFSHPRQLVELLPALRQWARVEELLKALFAIPNTATTAAPAAPQPTSKVKITTFGPPKHLSVEELLTPPITPEEADAAPFAISALPIDVSLNTANTPTITLVLPTSEAGMAAISIQVLPNGGVQVSADSGRVDGVKATRALEACGGEVAEWVEWVRWQIGGTTETKGKREGGEDVEMG